MLDALLSHSARPTIIAEVVFVFMEKDRDRAKHLESELASITLPANVTVSVENGNFHELMESLLDGLESDGQRLAPTFAFIDPFGYKETRLDVGGRILGHPGCEILVYVPIPFIARFMNSETIPIQALEGLFGDGRWRQAQGLANQLATERKLTDLLVERIAEGCTYVRSFEIVGSGPNNGATLFFGTNHRIGLEKMKEAMWKADPVSGLCFKDSTDEAQLTLIDEAPDFRFLETLLHKEYGGGQFGIEEALDFVVEHTPFLGSHVKTRTLKPAEEAGRLEVVATGPKRRAGTFPGGTRLRFVEVA